MAATVWLVRHASTAWSGRRWCGSTDLPLTAAGRAEAERLAMRLAPILPADVELVSSPTRRATETATTIARVVGTAYLIDPALREVDFGRAEGLTWQQLEQHLPEVAEALAAGGALIDWPGGESAADVRARVAAIWSGLDDIAGPIVMVIHGGLIRGLIAHAIPSRSDAAMVPPASATAFHHDGAGWFFAGVRLDA